MYNRLFTKILDSSIWLEADTTRIVWITLLAAMDEDGYASFSCDENLARRANVPLEALKRAIQILESPDKFNPNDEFEGKRIEKVQGGWMVLKAPYYRTLLTREIAREQTRIRVQKHRAKGNVTNKTLPNVTRNECNTSEHSKVQQSKEEEIYCAFPRKVGKPIALKAIRNALSKTPFDVLLQKTKDFAVVRNGDVDFCPMPATWFNQERYNDDPSTWVQSKPIMNGQRQMSAFEIEKRITAINQEVNATFKRNGKRVEGDGIDELKKRRDELQKQLTA